MFVGGLMGDCQKTGRTNVFALCVNVLFCLDKVALLNFFGLLCLGCIFFLFFFTALKAGTHLAGIGL